MHSVRITIRSSGSLDDLAREQAWLANWPIPSPSQSEPEPKLNGWAVDGDIKRMIEGTMVTSKK